MNTWGMLACACPTTESWNIWNVGILTSVAGMEANAHAHRVFYVVDGSHAVPCTICIFVTFNFHAMLTMLCKNSNASALHCTMYVHVVHMTATTAWGNDVQHFGRSRWPDNWWLFPTRLCKTCSPPKNVWSMITITKYHIILVYCLAYAKCVLGQCYHKTKA